MTIQNKLIVMLFLAGLASGCSSLPKEQTSELIEPQVQSDAKVATETVAIPRARYNDEAEELFAEANELRDKDAAKALALYQSAITLDPTMKPAYYNQARLHFAEKSYDAIESVMTLATQNSIQSAPLHNLYATALRQQGQFQKAKEHYLLALAIDKNYSTSLVNLAILSDIYLQDLVTAEEYYLKYQATLSDDSPQATKVKNWLADLQRRLNTGSGG